MKSHIKSSRDTLRKVTTGQVNVVSTLPAFILRIVVYVSKRNIPFTQNGKKVATANQIQKMVESVHGFTGYGSPTEQPHVHFTDGTAINFDGTIHDAGNGVPKLTNKVKKWLADNGWPTESVERDTNANRRSG